MGQRVVDSAKCYNGHLDKKLQVQMINIMTFAMVCEA